MKSSVTFRLEEHPKEDAAPKASSAPQPLRRGAACPKCGAGHLEYNGLLELECPSCGFSSSSGAGCT